MSECLENPVLYLFGGLDCFIMLAPRFLVLLKKRPSRMFRADVKAQVTFDYDRWQIKTFLCWCSIRRMWKSRILGDLLKD